MTYLICKKHNKTQKTYEKVLTNANICLNKTCTQSYKIICSICKNEHRQHYNKVINFKDITLLIQKMDSTTLKQINKPIRQTLQIIKKLKLIKEFRKKIEILQKQIHKQSLNLILQVQSLQLEYNQCKNNIHHLIEHFKNIQDIINYNQFIENTSTYFHNIQYNHKINSLELQNQIIVKKQQGRKKIMEINKKKITQVRDYSMKIIQVILHNDDTDDQDNDISYKKKHLKILKEQLKSNQQSIQNQSDCKKTRSRASSCIKTSLHKEIQTNSNIFTKQQLDQQIQQKLDELRQYHTRNEYDLKLKLNAVSKQKDNINRQLIKLKQKIQDKNKSINQIQYQLKQNKGSRTQNLKIRQDLVNKFIEIWKFKGNNNQ